jgi:type I restriction enzyme S subunit
MGEWQEMALKEVAFINPSELLPKGTMAKKVAMTDLQPFTKKVTNYSIEPYNGGMRFRNGDSLVARITPCLENGKTAYVDILDDGEVGFGSTEYIVIREKPEISDKKFLYYFSISPEFRDIAILSMTGSSGRQRVQTEVVTNHKFLLPSLPEQKAIASVLSSLDDKIDLLHRQNKTLEAMAQALFRHWFVEKVDHGFKNEKFEKWLTGTLGGEWGKETPEGDFKKAVYCIRGTDIAALNTGIPFKIPLRFIKENKFENINPSEGDLVIEISGGTENQSTGRICYVNDDIKKLFDYPLIFSNFCRLIKVKKPEYSYFLYCYIQYLYSQDEFFNLENGSSGIKNLDYKTLLFDLDYPMPHEQIVIKFHQNVMAFFKKINQNKFQIRTLEKLRDTLLPKLMSGEVRVEYEH